MTEFLYAVFPTSQTEFFFKEFPQIPILTPADEITNVECVCTHLTQLYLLVEYKVFSI